MILSAQSIRERRIVVPCNAAWKDENGNSAGLSSCGFDLTLDLGIVLWPGEFKLVSVAEKLLMPDDVVGIIHDKSSLARRGLAVQNTVAEPGWRGYLTLELTNHGQKKLQFFEGCAIAQIIFHVLDKPTDLPYDGKYQDQQRGPQGAR